MRKGLFVTGTDTSVGKTVVSAALFHRYRERVPGLRYWKPIQTGTDRDDDTKTVKRLGACFDNELIDRGIRLRRPLSPHVAARLAGVEIGVDDLVRLGDSDVLTSPCVVEGAGGLLVPLNDTVLLADFMAAIGLPILLVTRAGLGTINHTLLTLEAMRHRSLPIAGVVMVGDPNSDNREAIERYGHATVLAEMPLFPSLSAAHLEKWAVTDLDPHERLLTHLT